MKKLIQVAVFVFAIIQLFCVSAFAFSDVKDASWYAKSVDYVSSKGYMVGYQDGSFLPKVPLKKIELCVLLGRISGVELTEDSNWYDDHITFCIEKGYIAPSKNYQWYSTREEAIGAFSRMYQDITNITSTPSGFIIPDFEDISWDYLPDIVYLYDTHLCKGKTSQGHFQPKSLITRAEISKLCFDSGL